jgi:hypothetical protein
MYKSNTLRWIFIVLCSTSRHDKLEHIILTQNQPVFALTL